METIEQPTARARDHIEHERGTLESKAAEAKSEATRRATEAYEEIKTGARDAVAKTGTYARDVVSEQKERLAAKLEEYRDAARAAGERLEGDDDGLAAEKVRAAASGLGHLSTYLRDHEPTELLSDAGRAARRHPELVFGGMFLAGLGLARFLKASRPEPAGRNYRRHRDYPVTPVTPPVPPATSAYPSSNPVQP